MEIVARPERSAGRAGLPIGEDTYMNRWIQHWQALPVQNRIGAAFCMAALVVIIVILVFQINGLVTDIYHAMPRH